MSSRPVTQHDNVDAIDSYYFRSIQTLQDGYKGDTETDYKTMTWKALFDQAFPEAESRFANDSQVSLSCSMVPLGLISHVTSLDPLASSPIVTADSPVDSNSVFSSGEDDGDSNDGGEESGPIDPALLDKDKFQSVASFGMSKEDSPFKEVRLLGYNQDDEDQLASFPMKIRCDARGVLSTFGETELSRSKLVAAKEDVTTSTVDPVTGSPVHAEDLSMKQLNKNRAWYRTEKLVPKELTLQDGTSYDLITAEDTSVDTFRAGETVRCSAFLETSIGMADHVPLRRELTSESLKLEKRATTMKLQKRG